MSREHNPHYPPRRVSIGHMQVHWGEMTTTRRHPQALEYHVQGNDRPHAAVNIDRDVEVNRIHMREVLWDEIGGLPFRFSLPPRSPRVILSSWADPLFGESFCTCYRDKGRELSCVCGESDSDFDWVWDNESRSSATQLRNENREVRFHTDYSCGTAAVRGNRPMLGNQYYWEIKMTTPVYGTDMMVGIGTNEADLDRCRDSFCSLLGSDCESWGLSYTGLFYHQGKAQCYAPRFGQGSIIGIHLDMWNGTLSFYKNRHSLGVACKGLKGKTLYPMVSSTAARSGMKVIRSRSFSSSLQYLCCLKLRQIIPSDLDVLDVVTLPPGLALFLQNNLGWLLGPATTSVVHCYQCRCSKQNLRKSSVCHSCAPDVCNNSSTRVGNVQNDPGDVGLDSSPHCSSSSTQQHSSQNTSENSPSPASPTGQHPSTEHNDPSAHCAPLNSPTEACFAKSEADIVRHHACGFGSRNGSSAKRKYSSSSSEELGLDDDDNDDDTMESNMTEFKSHQKML